MCIRDSFYTDPITPYPVCFISNLIFIWLSRGCMDACCAGRYLRDLEYSSPDIRIVGWSTEFDEEGSPHPVVTALPIQGGLPTKS